jgi:hypothetical protein
MEKQSGGADLKQSPTFSHVLAMIIVKQQMGLMVFPACQVKSAINFADFSFSTLAR